MRTFKTYDKGDVLPEDYRKALTNLMCFQADSEYAGGQRVAENHKAAFDYDASLVEAVLARCTEVDSGARNVDHILTGTLLPEIAQNVLAKMAEGSAIARIKVSATPSGALRYRIT